jgi:hypothetical protein
MDISDNQRHRRVKAHETPWSRLLAAAGRSPRVRFIRAIQAKRPAPLRSSAARV